MQPGLVLTEWYCNSFIFIIMNQDKCLLHENNQLFSSSSKCTKLRCTVEPRLGPKRGWNYTNSEVHCRYSRAAWPGLDVSVHVKLIGNNIFIKIITVM